MTRTILALALLALVPLLAAAQTRLHARLDILDGRVNGFTFALSDEYRVPERDICAVRNEGLCDDDMREVLYIYTHSHYPLRHIARLRMRGATWTELYRWCGVERPVVTRWDGPPYGKAYGFYKKHGNKHARFDREGDRGPGRHRGRGEW